MKFFRLRADQSMRSLAQFGLSPLACTIGNFDGVHLGHQMLVSQVLAAAKQRQLMSAVLLFEPQPIECLRPEKAPPRLMSWREKLHHLSSLGVEAVLALRFDRSLSQLSSKDFVEQLLCRVCQARHVVVGDDFRFGHQRSGSITDIDRFGQSMGLTVEQSQTCLWEDVRVSSTRIREALSAGELPDVHKMLGRPFEMAGKVVYGDQLGRTIGFPTANLKISQPSLPCRGVYAVSVTGAGLENQNAVANLGVRPTLDGVNSRCEVHILGQAMAQLANQGHSLYGERLRIRFEQKLRDEQRFESVSALKSAIEKDITAAKRFFDASGEE